MRKADEGVAPVVAVALLIGLVAVAGAIIGLSMFAALEEASGALPDVRFQVSADGKSLYHAGGDALPLKNLVFYDTSTKKNVTAQLIKNGKSAVETSLEEAVWETGDRISFDGALGVLSIVGLDSRNRPALLYLGADAVVLSVGDMVPDEWTAVPPKPIGPTPVPTPSGGDTLGAQDVFNPNDKLSFGNIELISNKKLNKNPVNYPLSEGDTKINVVFDSQNSNKNQKMYVVVYDQQNNVVGQGNPNPVDIFTNNEGTSIIPTDILKKGYVCNVTIEILDKNNGNIVYRGTVSITIV